MLIRLALYIGYYALNLFFLKDVLAFVVTLPIMLVVVYNLLRMRGRYIGVEDMVTLIMYLYFVIEPLQRLDHGHIGVDGPVSVLTYNSHYIIGAALWVFVFYVVYTAGMQYLETRRGEARGYTMATGHAATLLLVALVSFAAYVALSGGFGNLLAGRLQKNGEDNVVAVVALASQTIATFLLALYARLRVDRNLLFLGIAVGCLMIASNPFNTARFFLIATYVPLALIAVRGRLTATAFYLGAMVMIVVGMPILNATTRSGRLDMSEIAASATDGVLGLPFLDVYDMLVECGRYTDVNGHTYGAKLVGDALFLVPRAIWTSKPTLNGLDIGNELAQDRIAGTSNLSMFVIGDGYRDLGYFGVIITAVLLVLIVHFVVFRRIRIINGSPMMHYVFIASLPILIRGPISAVLPLFFLQAVMLAIYVRLFARPAGVAGVAHAAATRAAYPPLAARPTRA